MDDTSHLIKTFPVTFGLLLNPWLLFGRILAVGLLVYIRSQSPPPVPGTVRAFILKLSFYL